MGQTDSQVKFYANTFSGTVFVTSDGITYSIADPKDKTTNQDKESSNQDRTFSAIKENFVNANELDVAGVQQSASKVNYFVGNNKQDWHTNVPTYESITLGTVWHGINLDLKAYGNNVEKIFTVNPGSSEKNIKINMEGVKSLAANNGQLLIKTEKGDISMTKPVAYQKIDGATIPVDVSYTVSGTTYGFDLGKYDKSHPVIIDPLVASTYLGGSDDEGGSSIVLGLGNVYVTGQTCSSNFPTAGSAYQGTAGANCDAFVSKLDSGLTTLVASTYLGGSGVDSGSAIVFSSGNVYVTGSTTSTNFPTTGGAYQTSHGSDGGNFDVFVSELDSGLTTLVASTYLGGSSIDFSNAITLGSGNVYVTGYTSSSNFPVTGSAYQGTFGGIQNAFVSKINSGLTTLVASTYLGGNDFDSGGAIILDGSGNVYVTGTTGSTNFPTAGSAYQETIGGSTDAFVSKIDSGLTTLVASTYLGGSGVDSGSAIILNGSGTVYVTGQTGSSNFPTAGSAYQTTYGGNSDAFVSKLNSGLTTLVASTYLGKSGTESGGTIALGSGNVYVTGTTGSTNFPTTDGVFQRTIGGVDNAFVSKIDSGLTTLVNSTYLGGSGETFDGAITLDGSGNVYVTGQTGSSNFPTAGSAYQTTYGGNSDAFVTEFDSNLSGSPTPTPSISLDPNQGPQHTTLITVTGSALLPSHALTIDFGGNNVTPGGLTSQSDGTIPSGTTFTVPTESAGIKTVTVSDGLNFPTQTFTVTVPTISLSSTQGPAGTQVTISISGFSPNGAITFTYDGTPLTVSGPTTADGSGQIQAGVTFLATGTAGSKNVIATDSASSQTSNTATFTVTTPTISLSSTQGPINTPVTVSGSGFAPSGAITFTYDGSPLTTSPVTVTADVTGHIPAGVTFLATGAATSHSIVATDSVSSHTSNTVTFTVTVPTISLNSTQGPINTPVTASGSGFSPNHSITFTFAGNALTTSPGTVTANGTGHIPAGVTFAVPTSSAGAKSVVATDSTSGQTSNTPTFTVTIPTISLSPALRLASTPVTVSGSGFSPNGAITFTYDGNPLTVSGSTTADGSGQIQAGVTFLATGAATVHSVIATDFVSSQTSNTATFTITGPIITLSPIRGPAGISVTVTGINFLPTSAITIKYDTTNVTPVGGVTTNSAGSFTVTITVPQSAPGSHNIVATDAGLNSNTKSFTISSSISLSPTTGSPGSTIRVAGAGFTPSSIITIKYDGIAQTTTPIAVTTNTAGSFSATFAAPSSFRGTHSVTATDGTNTPAASFIVTTPVLSLSPTFGPASTQVTVSGSGFAAISHVTILYGGTPVVTSPGIVTSTATGSIPASVTFTVPSSTFGAHPVSAKDAVGNTVTSSFAVTKPTIILSPTSGASGIPVLVTGSNFVPNSAITIKFDSINVTPGIVTADGAGHFVTSITIPTSTAGSHTISSKDASGNTAVAIFART